MVPIFVVLLLSARDDHAGWRLAATAVFVLASLTDRFDGEVARRRGTVTDFGKIADPIADKALIGAALISLSSIGDLPWWVTVVIMVARDRHHAVAVLGDPPRRARRQSWRQGQDGAAGGRDRSVPVAADRAVWHLLRAYLMGAAVIITLVTGVDYVARAMRLRRARRAERRLRGDDCSAPARRPARIVAPAAEGGDRRGRHRIAARRHRQRQRGVARS